MLCVYDACDAVGYFENMFLHGCYHINVVHWRSRLEYLSNFVLSRDIFNLGISFMEIIFFMNHERIFKTENFLPS